MSREQAYRQALEWIHSIGRFGINPGLERITALLDHLGNPHHTVRFVHIGGSNGKGSTAVMLTNILQSAGYRVALYTSPYLVSFTNRMSVNGRDIEPDELIRLVELVRPVVDRVKADPQLGQPTEFEVVTALAFCHFARQRPDLVVLEVGLGGRLDATNVVTPLLSIITNVSLEHTAILGDTVTKIAGEKAGIIKPEVPVLTAAEDSEALAVIEAACRERCAPLYRVADPASTGFTPQKNAVYTLEQVTPEGQYFSYHSLQGTIYNRLFIPLRGRFQLFNAATALAAAELLKRQGFSVPERALRHGLEQTAWPGRMELLASSPALILDGAHNPAAMRQLSVALPEYFKYRRLILVLGVLADKELAPMLESILPLADHVIVTQPDQPRAAEPQQVAEEISKRFPGPVDRVPAVSQALQAALRQAAPGDAVLVTGSLYTVSEARTAYLKNFGTP